VVSIPRRRGFGASHAIRQSLVFLNMPALQQPEVYLSRSDSLFDGAGRLADERTRRFLGQFLEAFEACIGRLTA